MSVTRQLAQVPTNRLRRHTQPAGEFVDRQTAVAPQIVNDPAMARLHGDQNDVRKPAVNAHGLKPGCTVA